MKRILLIIFVLLIGCGKDYSHKGSVGFSSSPSTSKICLEGHVYYFVDAAYMGGLAPKLNDEGKPVKCEVEDNEQ